MKQTVEIIIPTYKPNDRTRSLLEKLTAQTFKVQRIHIINTDRQYWRSQLIEGLGAVRIDVTHIKGTDFDHGGTRDFGVSVSEGQLLLFMTQDAVPAADDMVEQLVRTFEVNQNVAVAYARQLPVSGQNDYIEDFTRRFNYPGVSALKSEADIKTLGIKTFFCSDVCAMYSKDIYYDVGGFVSPTIFNEDMIFAADAVRKGYKIAYCAEAKVYHSHCYTGLQLLKRNFDMGVSQREYADRFDIVSSEKEGMRLVKKTAAHLVKAGHPCLVIKLIWTSACKYIGYFLGKRYLHLPMWLVKGLTANPGYWNNKKKGNKNG